MTIQPRAVPSDDDFRAAIRQEERENRRAAKAFAVACAGSDPEALMRAVDGLGEVVDGWLPAMRAVGRLESIAPEIREAFHSVWVEHKMLPLRVGNRRALADALRRLMPPLPAREDQTLYRGASFTERRRRLYGFSWTTKQDIARRFAEHWVGDGREGVILTTRAPADAILLVREDEGYYDEGEVVVDPFALGLVSIFERLRA